MADKNSGLVDEISRELVAEVAPEELDLFEELAADYHANPSPPKTSRGGDDALGFGLDAAMIATSPAAMAAVSACLAFVAQVAMDALKDQSTEIIKEQIKRLFATKKTGPTQLRLDADQLARARSLAASEARRFGLSKADADRLADALAGRLAMNG